MTTLDQQPISAGPPRDLPDRLKTLTRREAQVLEYLVRGLTNDQIALELFRSPKTIDKHCQNIYQKTGIHKRVNLVREVMFIRSQSGKSAGGNDSPTAAAIESITRKSRAWDTMRKYESILSRSSGVAYFGDLVKALAETFGVKMAGICEVSPKEGIGVIIAYCVEGELRTPYQYNLSNSACGLVHAEGRVEQLDNLAERFDGSDCLLVDEGFKSYVGIRLDDRLMGPIGTLWIADDQPIDKDDMPLEILKCFAPSAAAELATQIALDNLT